MASAILGGACGPTFDTKGVRTEDFERDRRDCIAQSSAFSPSRYRPGTWTDWKQYATCMESKGYTRSR